MPVVTAGFEVETELTLQTLYHGFTIAEVQVPYRERPPGSFSKLNTFRDGFRVIRTIFSIFRSFKPLTFFGLIAVVLALLSVLAATPAVLEYFGPEHRVLRWPLLIVGVGFGVISFTSLTVGVLLNAMNHRLKEITSLLRKVTPPRQMPG